MNICNYLIGICNAMESPLKWCAGQWHKTFTVEMLRAAKGSGHLIAVIDMADGDMECLSCTLWSWVQVSPHGQAEFCFDNAKTLSGADVSRKLLAPLYSRNAARRFALRDQVRPPPKQPSFQSVLDNLVEWGKNVAAFAAACGATPTDNEPRHSLMAMFSDIC